MSDTIVVMNKGHIQQIGTPEDIYNEPQNAFYFSQIIKFDTDRVIECVYRDIQDTLESMKRLGYKFDVVTIKKGYSIEVSNIKR